ncbi:MAG: ABC transporter substrate-binding protein [Deltaproteobacteria bacterium]|jgi:peptide/nickel transport system substrate-binding protein|nr:ABC transporter substrate-binding protein [Deltaproteobacteria bacterium]
MRKTSSALWPALIFGWLLTVAFLVPPGSVGDVWAAGDRDSIRIGIAYLPTTLDPQGFDDQITESILSNVYDPIVRVDAKGDIVPGGAEKWEISPDGLEYVFHLYPDATFHDGAPVRAIDAKLTVERCVASSVVGTYFRYIDRAEVVDDLTLKVVLKHPYGAFLPLLGAYGGLVEAKYLENNPKPFVTEALGSGPYRLVEYRQGDQFILKAHDGFHTAKAPITDLVYKQISNAASSAMALEAGELDVLVNAAAEDIERLNSNEKLTVSSIQSLMGSLIQFNAKVKPFDDVRVRQALAHAIDKNILSIGATNGLAIVADAHIPPGVPGYSPDIKSPDFDQEKAKQLLADAGYPDGFTFKLTVNQVRKAHAEVIQAQLREVGVVAEIELLEAAAFYEAKVKGSFEAFVGGWGYICLDPDVYIYDLYCGACLSTGNYGAYENPEVDKLLEEGKIATDKARRQEIYEQVSRITLAEAPNIPLLWNAANLVFDKDLKGVEAIATEQYYIYRYSW